MHRKILALREYLGWAFKKYQELQSEIQNINAYKIVDIVKSTDGSHKIKVQVSGTGKIVEWSPEEIVADDILLEGFSKKDIRTITYFACEEIHQPQYKIVSHEFSEKRNMIIFRLKQRKSNKTIEQTAAEISTNMDLINQCNNEDVLRAGYLYGAEETEKERKFIDEFNSN